MKTVYKYPFPIADVFTLKLPDGAQVIHIEEQLGTPTLWALVDPNAPSFPVKFRLAGTGHSIEERVEHVGTFFMRGGALVWHLFTINEDSGARMD